MNKELVILSNTKMVISILVPIIATIIFFVSMQTRVDGNSEDIKDNRVSLVELENQVDGLNALIIENNTNIKLLQKDIAILITQIREGR